MMRGGKARRTARCPRFISRRVDDTQIAATREVRERRTSREAAAVGGVGCSQDEMRAECRHHLGSSSMRPGGGTLCR